MSSRDIWRTIHNPVGVLGLLERGEIGHRDSPRSFHLSEAIKEYLLEPRGESRDG